MRVRYAPVHFWHATDFTSTGFPQFLDTEDFTTKINEQITHLKYERVPGTGAKKLDGYKRERAKKAIDRAMKDFEKNLTDDAGEYWTGRQALTIENQNYNAACTAISSTIRVIVR